MGKMSMIAAAALLAAAAFAQEGKKFIGHGWDFLAVSPKELLANADALDRTALDGVSIVLKAELPGGAKLNSLSLMTDPAWTFDAFGSQLPTLKALAQRRSMRHSFAMTFWAPHARLGWTDDAAWARFARNLGVLARIAKASGLEGIIIDAEDYSGQRQYFHATNDPPMAACAKLARRRGAETMSAMAKEYPEIALLSFWFLSAESHLIEGGRLAASVEQSGDLWPSFINGMLDALPPEAKLVDGNENAYRHEAARKDFQCSAWKMLGGVLPLVAPENARKYRSQAQASFGLYVDMYVTPTNSPWYFGPLNGSRLAHWQANLHGAAQAATEYVWIYGEKHSWVKWQGLAAKNYMEMKTWDEALPGFTAVMNEVKDPAGAAARMLAQMHRDGTAKNLIANSACLSKEPLAPGKFYESKTPAPFSTWQEGSLAHGVLGLDTQTGFGDKSSLKMKGCGSGCFIAKIPNVKTGEIYLVAFAAKGSPLEPAAYWQLGGKWNWNAPGVRFAMGAPDADGWRTAAQFVHVPENADEMEILLSAKQAPGEEAWFDAIEAYLIR